jgi:hypothetical protein
MKALNVAITLLVLPLAALPQAVVEYGAAVGRAGVAGGSMGAAGKSTGKLLEQSVQGMQKVQSQKGKVVTKVAKGAEPAPPVAVKVPRPSSNTPSIDPAAIPVGLERDELFRQFGKPSTRITQQQGTDVVEKCWYKAAGFDAVVVTLRNGKVASVGT